MGSKDASYWADQAMVQDLTTREREIRDRFVDEYFHDYDPIAAAMRCGFMHGFAQDYAKVFMREPYVQQQIKERQLAPITKEEDEIDKRRVRRMLFREAEIQRGAGRVAALAQLKNILGMDAPIKTQQEVLHRGRVMTVPAIANVDEWEEAASASQSQLISDAQSDS